jgi:hypothetical protein
LQSLDLAVLQTLLQGKERTNVLLHTGLMTRPHDSHLSSSPWQVVAGIGCCGAAMFTDRQYSHARRSVTSLSQKLKHGRRRLSHSPRQASHGFAPSAGIHRDMAGDVRIIYVVQGPSVFTTTDLSQVLHDMTFYVECIEIDQTLSSWLVILHNHPRKS